MTALAEAPTQPRSSWWFEPVPIARIALLRAAVYLFIPIDVLITSGWVRSHASHGAALYQPLAIARWMHLPAPTSWTVNLLAVALVAAGLIAATGWAPRITGSAAGVLYLAWMIVAMSYGKVDHDRFAYLIALAVLPTVGPACARVGPGRSPDRLSAEAGWALRVIQLAVVATYFLAAWSKIRFGGVDWPTGATLERALLRRQTFISSWMLNQPELLVPMQFAMIGAELLSPLVLLARSARSRTVAALGMWSFHLAVFAGVTIIFLPHCVAILAFVPLESAWAWISTRLPRRLIHLASPTRAPRTSQPAGQDRSNQSR
jgi:hypothetical protein